ncbi:MAG: ATP-binding protein [Bacteroidia bacterium]
MFLIVCSKQTFAQNYQIRTVEQFKIDEGLIQNNNNNLEIDSEGKIWVSGPGGTQWSNGREFYTIEKSKTSRGLSSTEQTPMMPLKDGRMLFVTTEGLSFYDPQTHRFEHRACTAIKNQYVLQILLETPSQIWFACTGKIIIISKKDFSLEKTIQISIANLITFQATDTLENTLCVYGDSLVFIDIKKTEISRKVPIPKVIEETKLWGFHLLTTTTVAIYYTDQIYVYDTRFLRLTKGMAWSPTMQFNKPGAHLRHTKKSTGNYVVAVSNQLFEVNFNANTYTQFATNKGLIFDQGNFTDICLYENTVWLTTSTQGVFKMNLFDDRVRYFGTEIQAENFIKCIHVSKKNKCVLAGTLEKGLLIFDTLGNLIHRKTIVDERFPNGKTVSAIIDFDETSWLIAMYETGCIYRLYAKDWRIEHVGGEGKQQISYYGEFRKLQDGRILYGEDRLIYDGSKFQVSSIDVLSGNVLQTKAGAWWNYRNNSVSILDKNKVVKNLSMPSNARIKQLVEDQQQRVWMATDQGLLLYSAQGKFIRAYTRKDGLPDDQIYALAVARDGAIWLSHNKGLSCLKNDAFVNFSSHFGLQENEFNSSCVFQCSDGQLFFGGINGITAFYPNDLLNRYAAPQIKIAALRVNDNPFFADSSYWKIDRLDLSYAQHILAIDFFASGILPHADYVYQYRVIGVDKEWVSAGKTGTMRYQLNPGSYNIEFFAGAKFDPTAKAQKVIQVFVQKPWYQTWWFMLCAAILILLVIWQLLNYINRRRYQKQLQELKIQQELEYERQRISRDLHDNMGAYTSALIANVQQLETKIGASTDLKKMQSNAEQILSSLRETIWVLNNREVTMQSFSDTFKNYCFKVLRNFEDIAFDAEEKFSGEEKMSAARAIHLQKILQEGIQNTIKHTQATQIRFLIENTNGLKLTLEDNGAGFSIDSAEKGHGLENMRWRADKADCSIEISSQTGQGTKITITEKQT